MQSCITKPLPTQKYLQSILDYNPENGQFRWKWRSDMPLNWNRRWEGKIAGSRMSNGYIAVAIDKTDYKAHRLAWVYIYGDILSPEFDIDHRNLKTDDNSIKNLRPASESQNMANRKNTRNRTLPKGVHKDGKSYRAIIVVNNKNISLGHFRSIGEAQSAYAIAAIKYKGDYARIA